MTSSKNDWKVTRKNLKATFNKLSDSDIEGLRGHMDELPIKVQKAYSYDKKKTQVECESFFRLFKK